MFEVVYSHIRSIDIVNENYLTNHEPNKIIFRFISYSLRIHAMRRRKHLYQTASGDKEVKKYTCIFCPVPSTDWVSFFMPFGK